MSSPDTDLRQKVSENDVTVMRSYLEVDVAEWFSENQIPFAYEAFTIPSVVGPVKREWDTMVEAVRAVGRNDFDKYDSVVTGTRWEDTRPAEVLGDWNEIYDKHRLQRERVTVPVQQSLAQFNKRLVLPDFAVYKDFDGKVAPEDFDYGSYDYIVEVSGLYGVGIADEASEEDWWDWYRVSAVAFKEFAYKMLGLWDSVLWVVPNQEFVEDAADGIPHSVRNDDNYIIMNTTQEGRQLHKLADKIGTTADPISHALSPKINPAHYTRGIPQDNSEETGTFEPEYFEFDEVVMENVDNNEMAVAIEDNWLVYHGPLGEVYIHNGHAHVRESMWRRTNMIMLREYVLFVLSELQDEDIVRGLGENVWDNGEGG